MKRDIKDIQRKLDDTKNNDIIYKKNKLKEIFESDPDLLEILGEFEPRPLNKFVDSENPTEEELQKRQEILDYNESIKHDKLVPYLKLNNTQKEVINYICYDIDDTGVGYHNDTIKNQEIIIMCFVHEDNMETEYGITRADLLSYVIMDLLAWTNELGFHLVNVENRPMIVDAKYYCRRLKFLVKAPNVNPKHIGRINKYDTGL